LIEAKGGHFESKERSTRLLGKALIQVMGALTCMFDGNCVFSCRIDWCNV